MTPTNVTLMILIPVAIAGALVLGVFSGRLSATTRGRVELLFLGIFYPVMIAFWIWRTVDAAASEDWLVAAFGGGLTVVLGVQAVVLARKRLRAVGQPI